MDDGGSTTNLLSPNKGMGVVTGVGIDNPSSQSVHGMDHTTTPNEETTSQIPNENESVREKNNETDEDEVQLTRKRKKTSKVWDDFVVVTLRDGKKKAECKHCKSRLAITGSGPTSSYKRHLNSCIPHKQSLKNQQILNFQPSGCDVDSMPPLIGPDTKYDENKMREAIANWILSTEQPFATVEDVMFVKMMKTATPLFEKVSRVTITSDCFKVYEHEKKRLKALTKAASKISLTTDCWKSSHQKIEYMVITAHFVDHNWRFNNLLNFNI